MSAKKFLSILTSKFQANKEQNSPKFDPYLSFHVCYGILSLIWWSKGDKPKSLWSVWYPICYNFGWKTRNSSALLLKARKIIQWDDTEWINVDTFNNLPVVGKCLWQCFLCGAKGKSWKNTEEPITPLHEQITSSIQINKLNFKQKSHAYFSQVN